LCKSGCGRGLCKKALDNNKKGREKMSEKGKGKQDALGCPKHKKMTQIVSTQTQKKKGGGKRKRVCDKNRQHLG